MFIYLLIVGGVNIHAQQFEADGIKYNVTDADAGTVAIVGTSRTSGSITLPSSVVYNDKSFVVTEIGSYAFSRLSKLSIDGMMPSQLKRIGDEAFANCNKLGKTLVLPNTLETIGKRAFAYSSIAGTLVLPESLVRINEAAFIGCGNIEAVDFRAKSMPDGGAGESIFNGFGPSNIMNFVVKVRIGNSVERIPYGMFRSLYRYSLTFEEGSRCMEIGASAFKSDNPGVVGTVQLPASLHTIGNSAFKQNSYLTGITFSDKDKAQLTTIEDEAFSFCSSLAGSLDLPPSVESIGQEAFYNCTKLKGTIVLPESLKKLGNYAFRSCSGFTAMEYRAVSLPDEGVGYESFSLSDARKDTFKVIVAETVERVPASLFSSLYCYSLTFAENSHCLELGDGAFACSGMRGVVGEVNLPSGLRIVGNNAFNRNEEMTYVTFQEGVTRIGDNAFEGCIALKGCLDFPASLKEIGKSAFAKCALLSGKLALSAKLTNVGSDAFGGCVRISAIDYRCEEFPDLDSRSGFFATVGDSTAGIPIIIGKDVKRVPAYLFASHPNARTLMFEEGSVLESVGDYAFVGQTDTSKVQGFYLHGVLDLPSTLQRIGIGAFQNNRQFTSVKIPSTVESIGEAAFSGCDRVSKLYFGPANCTFVGNGRSVGGSFDDMGKSTAGLALTIGNKVTKIETGQFDQTNLASLTFEDGSACREIAELAFSVGTLKGNLQLPEGLQRIGYRAFYGTALSSVDIPESVNRLGRDAFSGCKQLAAVSYRATASTLDNPEMNNEGGSFVGAGISVGGFSLTIGSSVHTISDCLFENGFLTESKLERGGGIRSLAFAGNCSLDSIGRCAFLGNNLWAGSLEIPASVRSIGSAAFSTCEKISSVTVPFTVKRIGDGVFSGCTGLRTAYYDIANGNGQKLFPQYEEGEDAKAYYTLVIGPHVQTLPEAFCENAAIDSLSLHAAKELCQIGKSAFYACKKMRGYGCLLFPDGMKRIGEYAFSGCSNLISGLNLQASLEDLGRNSLEGVKVNCLFYNAPIVTKDVFRDSGVSFSGDLVVGASIKTIPAEMFRNCAIGTLDFDAESQLDSIGEYAFCDNLAGGTLLLPATVRYIGAYAFAGAGCKGELLLPDLLQTLGAGAFQNCVGLTGDIVISKKLDEISNMAFSGCKGLSGTLVIPAHVNTLGFDAFAGTGFDKLIIEDSSEPLKTGDDFNPQGGWIVKSPSWKKRATAMSGTATPAGMFADVPLTEAYIGRNLNYKCGAMMDMGVARYYYSPFNSAKSLETVTIGPEVKYLNDYQFSQCIRLKSISLPDGLESINQGTFSDDSSLASIQIPKSVVTVGNGSFEDCTSLEEVLMGSGLTTRAGNTIETTIQRYAFNNCERLAKVVLSENVVAIDEYAFRNCSSLNKLYCRNAVPQSVNTKAFTLVDTNACTLYVPLGSSDAYRSAMVWKDFMVEEKEMTGIKPIWTEDAATEFDRYDLNGHRLKSVTKGINIIRMSDGTSRKVLVK